MAASTTTRRRTTGGASLDMVALAATVTEKLTSMQDMSAERAKTVDHIALVQQQQQTQINGLVTDMAVLKTQHASFWKGISVVGAIITAVGAVIGFCISELLPHGIH